MLQCDPPLQIRMTFRSGHLAVRDALARVLSELGPLDLVAADLETIELVLAEALNNVVEHAYPGNVPGGPVDICCRTATDGLHVRIIDTGRAMPGGQLPDGKLADLPRDLADLPEGGFGWHMIFNLAQDVRYRRTNDRNILDLRLSVSRAG